MRLSSFDRLRRFSSSVDDEQPRTHLGAGTVRLSVIGNLIAHARPQREAATIFELRVQRAFDTQKNVPFRAPVIRRVTRRVLDHSNSNAAKMLRTPDRNTTLAFVFRSFNA